MRKLLLTILISYFFISSANAQMRQIHVEPLLTNNTIYELSFYSASTGYVAGEDNGYPWVGFTNDSGRTYTKRFISGSNVNTGTYNVNLPFLIQGVKAFSQDTIVVYGGFNITPAILYSTDGGLTYLLTYHFQGSGQFGFIYDIVFPQNNSTGYATDGYRVIKTTNKGQSWTNSFTDNNGFFSALDATDNNNIFTFPDYLNGSSSKLYKTSNAGSSWQQVTVPGSQIYASDFLTSLKGWINVRYNDSLLVYYTSTGGLSWIKKNDANASPIGFYKMRFVNDSTGYGLAMSGEYDVYKTSDTGRVWEPLPRNNNYSYSGYGHFEIQALTENQVWCGGEKEFIELTTNGGGTPFPRAYFTFDTVGVASTGIVKLLNFSKRNYTYKWYVNNVLVSTAYNTNFTHVVSRTFDSVKLVVNNGVTSDSVVNVQYYASLVNITGVSPQTAITGSIISITGSGFTNATAVTFGGVAAASFTVNSNTSITATVGSGASGSVKVFTPNGQGVYPFFTYIPPPTITSFSPTMAGNAFTVIITGTNFTGATSVKFGILFAPSFTVVSSTTISAVVQQGGASGAVTVTTPGGTASLAGFIYIPPSSITSVSPITGGAGTIINITGTNFAGATAVTVGGVNVNFTLNSPTSITATIANSGGPINIITPYGSNGGASFNYTTLPVINSISPLNGRIGSIVTITGANFLPNLPANIVYFGSVRAIVTSATANILTVIVPVAASSGFVTVNTNGLKATSPSEFMVSFPGDLVFTSSSFAGRVDFPSGSYTNDVAVGDFDGDGKPDIASVNTLDKTISIFRNTSTPGNLSFATRIDSSSGNLSPVKIAVGDIDLDGRLDIVVAVNDLSPVALFASRVVIYRNTSTPGIISFAKRHEFYAAVGVYLNISLVDILIADKNADGKQDIIVLNSSQGSENFTVFKNKSNGSAFNFQEDYSMSVTNWPTRRLQSSMAEGDLDKDSKMDFVIGSQTGLGLTFVGSASGYQHFTGLSNSTDVALSDFNGDGDLDLITRDNVYINTTSPITHTLSFTGFSLPGIGQSGSMSCLNGDAKPDFAACDFISSTVKVSRNTSTAGSASMAIDATYTSGQSPVAVATADFDLDQRPDILVANRASNNVSILRNQVQYTGPVIYSFTPSSGVNGTNITITGVNFIGATIVTFGGVAATSFIVVNPTTITAVVGTGVSGTVRVVTPFGTASLGGFTFGSAPVINSFIPVSGITGTVITITGANFTGATSVAFGGIAAASFTVVNSTTITAVVAGGASGAVSVTAPGGNANATGFSYIPPPVITSFTPTVGVQYTQVTISGANFIGVTDVSFGGVASYLFTVNNSSTITALVGTGATGNVVVTTLAGTASLAGFTFALTPTITSFTPISGPTGTTITITGTNFTGATTVSFGGIAATSFIIVNATTITATVGTGTTGSVSVTTPGGTATRTGFTFLPAPTISSFTPASAPAGTTITITGTNFTGATAVSFGGTAAQSFTVNSATSISAVVGTGATGSVSVTTPGGTATRTGFTYTIVTSVGGGPANNNPKELTVSPNPGDGAIVIKHPSAGINQQIRFIDILGREVKKIIPARNSVQTNADVSMLPQGIYKIIWMESNRSLSRTFMVK